MNFAWKTERVPLKFLLGDKKLFSLELSMQTCVVGLKDIPPVMVSDLTALTAQSLRPDCAGFLIRRVPIATPHPTVRWTPDYICYTPSQDPRYYIDLNQCFQ